MTPREAQAKLRNMKNGIEPEKKPEPQGTITVFTPAPTGTWQAVMKSLLEITEISFQAISDMKDIAYSEELSNMEKFVALSKLNESITRTQSANAKFIQLGLTNEKHAGNSIEELEKNHYARKIAELEAMAKETEE